MKEEIIVYTDGAARGNPGPGGYGIVMLYKNHSKELAGGFRLTTNNRMELMAVIVALESLKIKNIPIRIFTDSAYVMNSIEKKWLDKWIATEFKGGKKNRDLWMRYHHLAKHLQVKVEWVKGHADNIYNNRCDVLATEAADGFDLQIDDGYEIMEKK